MHNREAIRDLNQSIDASNNSLRKAFITTAAVAMGVAVINFPVRLGQTIDLGFWSDYVQNSDIIRYISNHVKGAGQAATQSQLVGMVMAEIWATKKENDTLSKHGSPVIEIRKDLTAAAASACMIGAYCWEKISQASHPTNYFDTPDMIWYGIGISALLSLNAGAKAVNNVLYPDTKQKYHEAKVLLESSPQAAKTASSSLAQRQAAPTQP